MGEEVAGTHGLTWAALYTQQIQRLGFWNGDLSIRPGGMAESFVALGGAGDGRCLTKLRGQVRAMRAGGGLGWGGYND